MPRKNKSKSRDKMTRKARSARRSARRRARKSKGTQAPFEARLVESLSEIERILDHLHHRLWYRPSGWEWPDLRSLFATGAPSVDVESGAREIVVTAEIPGIHKDDLDISVSDRILTISTTRGSDAEIDADDTTRQDLEPWSFSYTLTLPAEIDCSNVTAECSDGVLRLKLPKLPGPKTHHIPLT